MRETQIWHQRLLFAAFLYTEFPDSFGGGITELMDRLSGAIYNMNFVSISILSRFGELCNLFPKYIFAHT